MSQVRKRLKERLNEVIDFFIKAVISGQTSNVTKIFNLLSARGFLVELKADHIYLSDNSHNDDEKFLDELLKDSKIGYVMNGRIYLSGTQSLDGYRKIFQKYDRGMEACEYLFWSEWKDFKRRVHGRKVSVSVLESFIARLVKAVSAIGLTTCSSCDGHGKNKAIITFCGVYNKIWFCVVLHNFAMHRIKLQCNWNIKGRDYVITHPRGELSELYIEILSVANLLYLNRDLLIDIKGKTVSSIDGYEIEKMREDALYKLFESNFKSHMAESWGQTFSW